MYDVFTFEWDDKKSHDNLKKHGVSFEEALTVFYDEYAWCVHDPDHSRFEDRYLLFGLSEGRRSLVVCHIYKENDGIIRIISAREMTKNELLKYWG